MASDRLVPWGILSSTMTATDPTRLSVPAAVLFGLVLGACRSDESAPRSSAPEAVTTVRTIDGSAVDVAPTLEPWGCGTIPNMHVLGDVYTAGQPEVSDFALVRDLGVRTVINLRNERELGAFDERATVEDLGLAYRNIPFGGPAELSDQVLDQARVAMAGAEPPILLHCGSANRVGAVWIAWRALDEGVPLEQAVAEAKEVGLRSPELERIAVDYVSRQRP